MTRYSISAAEALDAAAQPNATDFCNTIRTIADGLDMMTKRAFIMGAIKAAELSGRHIFAFHLMVEYGRELCL